MESSHEETSDENNWIRNSISRRIRLLCMRDSEYAGFFIKSRSTTDIQRKYPDGDDNKDLHPFILLFPYLRWNPKDVQEILRDDTEPEVITRKLLGKKADFSLLRNSRNYRLSELLKMAIAVAQQFCLPNATNWPPKPDPNPTCWFQFELIIEHVDPTNVPTETTCQPLAKRNFR